jgi:hypothetical protein
MLFVKYLMEILACPGVETVAVDVSVIFIPQISVY